MTPNNNNNSTSRSSVLIWGKSYLIWSVGKNSPSTPNILIIILITNTIIILITEIIIIIINILILQAKSKYLNKTLFIPRSFF